MVNSIGKTYNSYVQASTNNVTIFAKINTNCYFLKTPTKITEPVNTYFILEESYFVKVISQIHDFYYVEYLNIKGYVEKEYLTLVNEQIETPYLNNITFETTQNTYLFSEPKIDENLRIAKINTATTLTYIGKIYAQSINDISGNTWYYCKIKTSDISNSTNANVLKTTTNSSNLKSSIKTGSSSFNNFNSSSSINYLKANTNVSLSGLKEITNASYLNTSLDENITINNGNTHNNNNNISQINNKIFNTSETSTSDINSSENYIYGYIHASFTQNLTPIIKSTAVSTPQNLDSTKLLNINLSTQIVITIIISVPILFVLFVFLKGFKKV